MGSFALEPAQAQQGSSASVSVSVPAGSLESALLALGRQANLQLVYSSALTAGKTTGGVSGQLSSQTAVSRLLAGTGLSYSFTGANTVRIFDPNAGGNGAAATVEGAIALDTIDVQGGRSAASGSGYQGTPDWVYDTPAGVSVVSRQAIQSGSARNARDLLDNVAGVYANRSEAQNPGIAVNIRGLQDQDRIVMMIDGARQSFQRNGHGTTQRTYVDTAFVRAIDVEKSSTSGVGSLGSLGGLVNFRTILADDLIQPGRQWGTEVNAATGTNGFEFDGSIATAAHVSESLSILGGVSRRKIGAYEVGKNGELDLGTTYDGNTMLFSGQEVFSSILKAEADLADHARLTLGWVRNESTFSTGNYDHLFMDGALMYSEEEVVNNTLTAAFDWNPDSDLIDLKARLYYNHLKNIDGVDGTSVEDLPDGVIVGDTFGQPSNYRMATLGGSLENTSRFDIPAGTLSLNYGAEAFRDDGKTVAPTYSFNGIDYDNGFSGGNPGGTRDVAGGFVNARLEQGNWLTVQGGLRYDWYHIAGNTTIYGNETRDIIDTIEHPGTPPVCPFPQAPHVCFPGSDPWIEEVKGDPYYPRYDVEVDRSDGAFLPTFTVAVKPADWLQPFVKYSRSFRPPTIMESFLNSGHSGVVNGYAPNPDLVPERGETYELGANVSADGIFSEGDSLRFKAVAFRREIEDYIALGRTRIDEANRQYTSYVNLADTTHMKGVEIEANYDARSWYIGGTYTYNHADWPRTYHSNGVNGYIGPETSVLFVQPETRFSIDGGVRLFDEKLTVGIRRTHVGETEPTVGTLQNNYKLDSYTIYDLYGSYAFDERTKLRFNVNNLTDVAYISALGADYYAMPGRTATVGVQFKF